MPEGRTPAEKCERRRAYFRGKNYFRHEGAKTRRLRRPSRGRRSQVLRSSRYRPAYEHLRARLHARCEPVQDTATAQERTQVSSLHRMYAQVYQGHLCAQQPGHANARNSDMRSGDYFHRDSAQATRGCNAGDSQLV